MNGAGDPTIVVVGDVQPNRENPAELFDLVRPQLSRGDLRVCQLEATLSERGDVRTDVRNPAHRVHPRNVEALTAAGFDVVTFAGNNNLDYGINAFNETIERCESKGIRVVGGGPNLKAATSPVVVEAKGTKIAFVNFCSILRDGYAATPTRAGISPLRVSTFYEPLENIYEQPATPARTVTVVNHRDMARVTDAIARAREAADIVVAAFHWGVHFTHDLADYQPEVAFAAIDAGADLVLGTHPHCLQAIDVYKGKYIFYSFGNFAFEQPEAVAREGVREYLSFYGLPTDSGLPQHPHPEHCRLTMIATFTTAGGEIDGVRITPVYFNDDAQPEPLEAGTARHEEVASLIESLSAEIGMDLERDGDELVVPRTKAREIDTREWVRSRAMSYPWLGRLLARSGRTEPVAVEG